MRIWPRGGTLTCVAGADPTKAVVDLPSFSGVTPLMTACSLGDKKARGARGVRLLERHSLTPEYLVSGV